MPPRTTRPHQVATVLNPEEMAAVAAAATAAGLSVSGWLRAVARVASGMGALGKQLRAAERLAPWSQR